MKKLIGVPLTVIALVVGIGGLAAADIPDSDDKEIHSCRNNVTGVIRVIDAEAGQSCGPGATELVWNQVGPTGPQGPVGETGPAGEPGAAGPAATTSTVSDLPLGPSISSLNPYFTHTIICPGGFSKVSSGGFKVIPAGAPTYDDIHFELLYSYPSIEDNGWSIKLRHAGGVDFKVHTYAVCLSN